MIKRAIGMACCVGLMLLLAGCGGNLPVTDDSPRFVGAAVSSTSDRTESSQRATVSLRFDGPVALRDGAEGDFTLLLNDEAVDEKSIDIAIEQPSDAVIDVVLMPSAEAEGLSSSIYYALYEGALQVTAADPSGALPHIASIDGSASAVLSKTVVAQIPSGLSLANIEQVRGSVSEDVPAETLFEIETVPTIRVISWIEFEPGGLCALVHNHEFYRYDDATRDLYAARIIEYLESSLGNEYSFEAEGSAIRVTAKTIADGQVIEPRVVEGIDVVYRVAADDADAVRPQ